MASSLIRINEATETQLQQLRGIGPKRAAYIQAYVREVGPIRTSFDLATATGLSVTAAEQLTAQIDWGNLEQRYAIHFWPLLLTAIGSAWLLSFAFAALLLDSSSLAGLTFSVAMLCVLLGGLLLSADLAIASLLKLPSETTRLFPAAVLVFGVGLLLLFSLGISSYFIQFPHDLAPTLKGVVLFVLLALAMTWLIYGPSLMLRALITSASGLARASLIYDLSAIPIVIGSGLTLTLFNRETWIEEIFAAWILAVVFSNALELWAGRTAFISVLSDLDRSRYSFVLRHAAASSEADSTRKTISMALTAAALFTSAALVLSFIRP